MRKVVFLLWIAVSSLAAYGQDVTQGSLLAVGKTGRELGFCPLKQTAVNVEISGFLARVNVKQEFENKFGSPIEATYVFPLSNKGAVDRMTMTVGGRTIRGRIMRREEARQTYETAKSEGKTASLLDQERENIFTQSVANIMPGESVVVDISYVETLKYEDGAYEFVFPMTVGPRYIPGRVRDAARISPPIARTRAGHDISIEVDLNAGVPVEGVRSSSHTVDQQHREANRSTLTLRGGRVIPNKDFILRYDVTGKRIEDAVLTHRDSRGGFFTMILQPPDQVATEDRTPKEIVFVLDTSGSMEGFPIEKAKEAMRLSLDGLYPEDTFNLITFAGDTEVLFEQPVYATQANLEKAQAFLAGRSGGGATEMMKAITAALAPSDSQTHVRIVCFMTDAFVSNEDEIIAEIQRHPKARVFSFGIGSSVNRMLLDKMAEVGNGEVEYVGLEDDGSKAARRFYERVRTPLLTDLSVDWNGMPAADVYPSRLGDLFSAKPVVLHGRYTAPASGKIKLRGKLAGQPYERDVHINLPAAERANDVLATLWARTRIDDLSTGRLKELDTAKAADFDRQITDLGLDFGLMTRFTSFVAVEDRIVNQNGVPTKIEVPVEIPAGVNPETSGAVSLEVTVGSGGGGKLARRSRNISRGSVGHGIGPGSGKGVGYGIGSGSASGSGNGSAPPKSAQPQYQLAPPPPASSSVEIAETVSEVVTVQASPSVLNATTTTRTVENLPLSSRFTSLLLIAPGGNHNSEADEDETDRTFSIDGAAVAEVGRVSGKTTALAPPDLSAIPASKLEREVSVSVVVDTLGNVISAKAAGGGLAQRKSAQTAAVKTKFAPTTVGATPVRLHGELVYRFRPGRRVEIGVRSMKAQPPTPGDLRLAALSQKLHVWLAALVTRIESNTRSPGENEHRFVHNGMAAVQIQLAERNDAVLAQLRSVGLEGLKISGQTTISGTIPAGRIAELAELGEVKLILPKI